jgi:DNA helicase II / ATP-dependent DNA helicase PcrA
MVMLNQEQKKAVTYDKGPLMVVSGPGTGKTRVISSRINHLIKNKKTKLEEILALTFSDKAAQEIEDRVSCSSYSDSWISTFHSFSARILRENALDVGLSPDFKIIQETNAWLLVKRNLDRFNFKHYSYLGSPNALIGALINHFNCLKDEMITPEKYLEFAGRDKKVRELALSYQIYQKILLENNCLDFGDLITYAVQLLGKNKKYQKQFKYLLIDEFQDTNYAQYQLVKKLGIKNVCVSADINQLIYQWRGAKSDNIKQFQKDYPQLKKISLITNYRSYQGILDLSHEFIKKDNPQSEKLKAQRKGKARIEHLVSRTGEGERNSVIQKILELKDNLNETAVLVRSNNEADLIARCFEEAGLNYRFSFLKGLYRKPIILDVIAYFNLLDNYHENSAVYRLLNFPFLKISPKEIVDITRYGYQKIKSIYSVLEDIDQVPSVSLKSKNEIKRIMELIKKHSLLASRKNISQVFISFLEDTGYLKHLAQEGNQQEIEYINQFYTRIKKFEETSIEPLLKNFMEEINLELELGESGSIEPSPDNQEAVSIMTVHSAKGLEFKNVFIANLVDQKFPTIRRRKLIEIPEKLRKGKSVTHLEEERKLFYVAMTRAKNSLFFTSAKDYGSTRLKKVSPFLIELGYGSEKEVEKTLIKKKEKKKKVVVTGNVFSYSQLEAFSRCPLQYQLAYVFKIPVSQKPILIFGKTMHKVLYDFIKTSLKRKVSFNDLDKIYTDHWTDDYYQTQKQRKQYFLLGKKMIKLFYKEFEKEGSKIALINKEPALEKSFVLNFKDYSIRGKIDRINETDKGVEIVDYKTGQVKEKLNKMQLAIYQTAVKEAFNLNPVKLTHYYLEKGKKVSFKVSLKEEEKIKKRISLMIKEIKKGEFPAKPGWNCLACDFNKICSERK